MSDLQLSLERMYLKDASFESPQSPRIFTEQWKPQMRLDINTRTENLDEQHAEVVLRATVEASQAGETEEAEERTAFICEVQYAGVFRVVGGDGDTRRRALGTACPNMLFPYVREAIDSLVVKGGFPALQLAPVNFEAVYAQALAQEAQRRADGEETTH